MPNFNNNACAALSSDDRETLWEAAQILASGQGFIMRITQMIGDGG